MLGRLRSQLKVDSIGQRWKYLNILLIFLLIFIINFNINNLMFTFI